MNAIEMIRQARGLIPEAAARIFYDAEILLKLNNAQTLYANRIIRANENYFGKDYTFSLVANQADYTYPSDMQKIRLLQRIDGSIPITFDAIEINDKDVLTGSNVATGGFYYIFGNKIYICPTPPASGANAMKLFYIPRIPRLIYGQAQAGAAASITLSTKASGLDNAYNGMMIEIDSGTGAGQRRTITDYVGSTKLATVDSNWATNPGATSQYATISPIPEEVHELLVVDAVLACGIKTGEFKNSLLERKRELLMDLDNAVADRQYQQAKRVLYNDFWS